MNDITFPKNKDPLNSAKQLKSSVKLTYGKQFQFLVKLLRINLRATSKEVERMYCTIINIRGTWTILSLSLENEIWNSFRTATLQHYHGWLRLQNYLLPWFFNLFLLHSLYMLLLYGSVSQEGYWMVFASIFEHASSAFIFASSDQFSTASSEHFGNYKWRATYEHFVNFPPPGISLLLKRFAPSNLADTFKIGQQVQSQAAW